MTELEELQAIIDNAPEGATHFTNDYYLKVEGNYCMVFNSLGVWSVPISNTDEVFIKNKPRILSDIKRIIELLKEKDGNITDEAIEGGKVYYKEV